MSASGPRRGSRRGAHRRGLRLGLVALSCGVVAAAGMLGPASTAHAADAQGCSGSAESYGPNGGLLDQLSAPGAGGTVDDPFDIFADSTVTYTGTTDQAIRNGSWSVDVGGVLGVVTSIAELLTSKSPLSGSIGADGVTSRSGEFAAKHYIEKLKLSGLHRVTVSMSGEGGASCTATVWIRLHQKFFESLLAVGGIFFVLVGLALFWLGAPSYAVENVTFALLEDRLSPPVTDGGT